MPLLQFSIKMIILALNVLVVLASQSWMQAIHAARSLYGQEYSVLSGISLTSIVMSVIAESAWFSYAIKTDAVAGYINALIALVSYAIITLVITASGLESKIKTLLVAASTIIFPLTGYAFVSADIVAIVAPALSLQFVPQVIKTIKSYGTPAVYGFSPVSATAVVVFNSLWLTYGLVNSDRTYTVSAAILLTCGVAILATQALSTRRSRAKIVHLEDACL